MAIEDGLYQCTLTLPPNAAFQKIVGPLSSTCNSAKRLVCLEACKKLHQLGELNDHLVPLTEEPMGIGITITDEKCLALIQCWNDDCIPSNGPRGHWAQLWKEHPTISTYLTQLMGSLTTPRMYIPVLLQRKHAGLLHTPLWGVQVS